MKLRKRISDLVRDTCPRLHRNLEGISGGLINEDLDFLDIFSGMEGGGKSNAIKLKAFTLAEMLDVDLSIYDSWFFSGEQFIRSLIEPANDILEVAGLKGVDILNLSYGQVKAAVKNVSLSKLDEVKDKWKWTFRILDEAPDLMHTEFMTRFNKNYTKIMMTIRELNMIFMIAFPDITMLNRYIRQFRVKSFNYNFILPDGSRALATYYRRNYIKIVMDQSRIVQTYTLLGDKFISRYPPNILTQKVPVFPKDTNEYEDYLKLKRVSTALLTIKSIEGINKDSAKQRSSSKGNFNLF